jgi:hypothetical protein
MAKSKGVLQKNEFDELLQYALSLSQNIANFINYLKQSDMKGSKHNF